MSTQSNIQPGSDSIDNTSIDNTKNYNCCGNRVPKNQFTYISQIIVIYAIIATSIVHLSIRSQGRELWLILLSSSLGYILPSPGLKFTKQKLDLVDSKKRIRFFFPHYLATVQWACFPTTQCCFKIHLPKTIHIDKEEWEVALVQLITPTQFLNISEEEAQFELITTDSLLIKTASTIDRKGDNMQISRLRRNEQGKPDKWVIRFTFPAGSYSSSKQVINVMDQLISDTIGKALNRRQAEFSISYAVVNKRQKIKFDNVVRIGLKLHAALFLKLGGTPSLKHETIFQGKNMRDIFKYNPNINAGYIHLYIYSDGAEHNIVGDTLAPLLRVLPFEPSETVENNNDCQHINHEITIPHYIPVSKSDFDIISIQITGDLGILVHFITCKTIVKLHFRHRIAEK